MAVILMFSLITTCFAIPAVATENVETFSVVSVSTEIEKISIEASDHIIHAYKVSEEPLENGVQFKIAIPVSTDAAQSALEDETSISNVTAAVDLFYIDVSIQGSGGKVVGKVWHLGFLPAHNLEISLWAGNTVASSKITSVNTTNITAWPGSTQVSSTPSASKFWDVTITGTMDGESFYYSTYDLLFNKKAVEYPDITDCFGNVFMTVPSSSSWAKVSAPLPALTTAQRNAYIAWYEQTYNNGNSLNWNDVQIHHIKPRAYGGTHANSNLMPLKTSVHTTVNTWWANY
ncbi:MAG: HNH endonuclease [Oscillospiraceae bacterium]|nr:HNH endonuclease [Oscillospiraceae bacterium]